MDIIDYVPEFGEYSLPEGLREELTGKTIEEQMRYFGTACFYDVALSMGWGKPRNPEMERRVYRMGQDEYVLGVIVDGGIIVGLYINSFREGNEVSLFKGFTGGTCVYSASDNNGAGYKEAEWYRYPLTLCKEFAETDY